MKDPRDFNGVLFDLVHGYVGQGWEGQFAPTGHATAAVHAKANNVGTPLHLAAANDARKYSKGVKVSDQDVAAIRIKRDEFHGEWNYTILAHRD